MIIRYYGKADDTIFNSDLFVCRAVVRESVCVCVCVVENQKVC
jgi:hypothetical protein